jgi:regulator of RNase E activity RraB
MTTIEEWREKTDAITRELLEDGSDPAAMYTIKHHFACQDFHRLKDLALALFKMGFEVTDAEEMELEDGSPVFCCDASKDGSLAADRIVAEIEGLLPLCEQSGVDYGGWGTHFAA